MKFLDHTQLEGQLFKLFHQFLVTIQTPYETRLKDNVGPIQFKASSMLFEQGPCTMGELAEKIGISKQQMTRLIASLEEKKLVARKLSDTDKRQVVVSLTPEASRYWDEHNEQVFCHFADAIRAQSNSETVFQALSVITEMLEHIQNPLG